jgi:hypothetical protein
LSRSGEEPPTVGVLGSSAPRRGARRSRAAQAAPIRGHSVTRAAGSPRPGPTRPDSAGLPDHGRHAGMQRVGRGAAPRRSRPCRTASRPWDTPTSMTLGRTKRRPSSAPIRRSSGRRITAGGDPAHTWAPRVSRPRGRPILYLRSRSASRPGSGPPIFLPISSPGQVRGGPGPIGGGHRRPHGLPVGPRGPGPVGPIGLGRSARTSSSRWLKSAIAGSLPGGSRPHSLRRPLMRRRSVRPGRGPPRHRRPRSVTGAAAGRGSSGGGCRRAEGVRPRSVRPAGISGPPSRAAKRRGMTGPAGATVPGKRASGGAGPRSPGWSGDWRTGPPRPAGRSGWRGHPRGRTGSGSGPEPNGRNPRQRGEPPCSYSRCRRRVCSRRCA